MATKKKAAKKKTTYRVPRAPRCAAAGEGVPPLPATLNDWREVMRMAKKKAAKKKK